MITKSVCRFQETDGMNVFSSPFIRCIFCLETIASATPLPAESMKSLLLFHGITGYEKSHSVRKNRSVIGFGSAVAKTVRVRAVSGSVSSWVLMRDCSHGFCHSLVAGDRWQVQTILGNRQYWKIHGLKTCIEGLTTN